MKRALVLLLLLAGAASLTTADSSAVVGTVSLSLSESSPYAVVSGTTLYYSANSGSFTVTATDSSPSTIATVDFPGVFGDDPAAGTATSHDYSWPSSASDSGSKTVTVVDSDTSTGTASFTVTPDTTAPTISNATPTEVAGAGDQYWSSSANTLWFRPAGSGSFTLNATTSDDQSGVDKVAFPDVSGTSGWAGSNGGTDTSSPYATPTTYSWTAGAAAPGANTLTATNGTGMTATAAVTVSADSTAPTGQTVALGGGPWFTSASVPLTIGAGADTGSGLDGTRGVVERASATLTNGSCGTFGAFSAVTLSGGADTAVTKGNCYRYRYKATDNVGNVSTASAASDAKVDTTPPTTPTLFFTDFSNAAASGTTVYYGAKSGTFTLTAATGDAESGIASYAFPAIAGFTPIGAGGTRTYAFTGTTTAPSGPLSVTATNGAGQTSAPASFTLVADSTAPTVAVLCDGKPCVASPYAKSVKVTVTASDGSGSGVGTIRYTVDGTDPTLARGLEYNGELTVRSLTRLKVRAYDKAGNASTTANVTIDSRVDKLVVTAPAHATVKAGDHYLVVRMSTTRRSLAGAAMTRSGVKRVARWHFLLPSGTSIVRLRLPAGLRRPAAYKVVWTLAADSQKAIKTTFVSVR